MKNHQSYSTRKFEEKKERWYNVKAYTSPKGTV